MYVCTLPLSHYLHSAVSIGCLQMESTEQMDYPRMESMEKLGFPRTDLQLLYIPAAVLIGLSSVRTNKADGLTPDGIKIETKNLIP